MSELKSSHDWLAMKNGLVLMDPDGWDRRNLDASMQELISEQEFALRLGKSTVILGAQNG